MILITIVTGSMDLCQRTCKGEKKNIFYWKILWFPLRFSQANQSSDTSKSGDSSYIYELDCRYENSSSVSLFLMKIVLQSEEYHRRCQIPARKCDTLHLQNVVPPRDVCRLTIPSNYSCKSYITSTMNHS